MKIVLDNQIFSLQSHGGISRYFCELGEALAKNGDNVTITSILHRNTHLKDCNLVENIGMWAPGSAGAIVSGIAPLCSLVSDALTSFLKPDVLHLTYYRPRSRATRLKATVVTVHDMIPERYPHLTSPADPAIFWKREAVCAADHVICVSENTKAELMEAFSLQEERISVVHHGIRPFPTTTIECPHERPYILYVGQRGGYKNFSHVVRSLGSKKDLREAVGLVAFGGPPFTEKERMEAAKEQVSIAWRKGNDGTLAAYYRHAAAFIYPSLHEGFGMPPLEAMAHQCPVLASFASSIPEVLGDAAMYFDPRDIDATAQAIETVLSSRSIAYGLIKRGDERVKRFTWEECAQKTRQAYIEAVS